jgi:cyclophilin family peptidyl-prolyl cis-trans isomerase
MIRLQIRTIFAVSILFLIVAAFAGEEKTEAEFQPPEGLHPGWYARIETDMGRIIARLLPEQAPQAVAHFAALAEGELEWLDHATGETHKAPFYDGVQVYKAEAGYRFEVGGSSGTGRGGPLLYLPREGLEGPVDFSGAGRLGMTRSPDGPQFSAFRFFVTYGARPRLTGLYPCFGVVVSGREIVLEISAVKTYSNGRPIDPVLINEIRIFSVGEPEPLPEPLPHKPEPRRMLDRRDSLVG